MLQIAAVSRLVRCFPSANVELLLATRTNSPPPLPAYAHAPSRHRHVRKLPQAGAEVQMVVPADMAFGDKGICIDNGECLVKPGSEVRYDLQLKRVAPTP